MGSDHPAIIFPGDLVKLESYRQSVTRRCGKELNSNRLKIKSGDIGLVLGKDEIVLGYGGVYPIDGEEAPLGVDTFRIPGFKILFGDRIVFMTAEEVSIVEYGSDTPDSITRESLRQTEALKAARLKTTRSLYKKLQSIKRDENQEAVSPKVKVNLGTDVIEELATILSQSNIDT